MTGTDYGKFEAQGPLREALQAEMNESVIKPFSFEVYKKTREEKVLLSIEKSKHRQSQARVI